LKNTSLQLPLGEQGFFNLPDTGNFPVEEGTGSSYFGIVKKTRVAALGQRDALKILKGETSYENLLSCVQ
jgi:hypothetical protein